MMIHGYNNSSIRISDAEVYTGGRDVVDIIRKLMMDKVNGN